MTALATGAAQDGRASGYRMQDYRAPTPSHLDGASVLGTQQAQAMWQAGQAAFIDVLPRPPRPPSLPAATIWRAKPRFDIPGSLWLPDTGYGALAPVMDAYFRRGLTQASGGRRDRMLVFYCLRDCWMSWNAAKRAMTMGYTNVAWYPDGTDGWPAAGYRTEPRDAWAQPSASE